MRGRDVRETLIEEEKERYFFVFFSLYLFIQVIFLNIEPLFSVIEFKLITLANVDLKMIEKQKRRRRISISCFMIRSEGLKIRSIFTLFAVSIAS